MTNSPSSLHATTPLARRREQAETQLQRAWEKHYRTNMIGVGIVTAALPTAASIDLARNTFDVQHELWVDAVHAADGTVLWHVEHRPDPLTAFRYADGQTWSHATDLPSTS